GIATNTSAIPALELTLATAGSLVEASRLLKARAEEIGGIAVDLAASRDKRVRDPHNLDARSAGRDGFRCCRLPDRNCLVPVQNRWQQEQSSGKARRWIESRA